MSGIILYFLMIFFSNKYGEFVYFIFEHAHYCRKWSLVCISSIRTLYGDMWNELLLKICQNLKESRILSSFCPSIRKKARNCSEKLKISLQNWFPAKNPIKTKSANVTSIHDDFFHIFSPLWRYFIRPYDQVDSVWVIICCALIACICIWIIILVLHNNCDLFIQPFTGTIFQVENAKICMMIMFFSLSNTVHINFIRKNVTFWLYHFFYKI